MADDVISLIRECLAGDKGSWDIFVQDFSRTAMKYLNGKFSNLGADKKEDIIQNVFVKLFRSGLNNFCGITKGRENPAPTKTKFRARHALPLQQQKKINPAALDEILVS